MGGHSNKQVKDDNVKKHATRTTSASGLLLSVMRWTFLIISISYLLYTSILLLPNHGKECSHNLSKQKHISHINSTPAHSSFYAVEQTPLLETPPSRRFDTQLKHIVFGIASSASLWEQRKQYMRQWWRPKEMRGVVWVDKPVRRHRRNEVLPEVRVSGNTSRFPYTNRRGRRSALRISRVVSETLRLGLKDVRWFVMGDDDTVFVVENLVRVLDKYDHRQMYYVGSSSESHVQNIAFSYGMAYGGGGFAISYPLAKALEKMQDRCLKRYPGLYGSDDRIQACMAELGLPLTREPGFHQYDVHGNLLGLLSAHPVAPLVSLHHIDVVDPIFPGMSRVNALQHFFESVKHDSASIIQQSICYAKKQKWSISISWGYAVQVIRGIISPRELEMPSRTFLNWHRRADYTGYAFNTRPVTKHPCQKPFIFYVSSVRYDRSRRQTVSVYSRQRVRYPQCQWKMPSPSMIDTIVVFKRPDTLRWHNCSIIYCSRRGEIAARYCLQGVQHCIYLLEDVEMVGLQNYDNGLVSSEIFLPKMRLGQTCKNAIEMRSSCESYRLQKCHILKFWI